MVVEELDVEKSNISSILPDALCETAPSDSTISSSKELLTIVSFDVMPNACRMPCRCHCKAYNAMQSSALSPASANLARPPKQSPITSQYRNHLHWYYETVESLVLHLSCHVKASAPSIIQYLGFPSPKLESDCSTPQQLLVYTCAYLLCIIGASLQQGPPKNECNQPPCIQPSPLRTQAIPMRRKKASPHQWQQQPYSCMYAQKENLRGVSMPE